MTAEGADPAVAERRQHVVVGVDVSAGSTTALRVAAREAWEDAAPLLVVHAWLLSEPGLPLDAPVRPDEATEQRLTDLLHTHVDGLLAAEKHGEVDVRATYGWGGRVLSATAEGARLVVVGSRGLGSVRGAVLGSVSHYVLEHAASPVMVVHDLPAAGPSRVVVGVDGSDTSLEALRWANSYALRRGVPLLAVHAGDARPSALVAKVAGEGTLASRWGRPAAERLDDWLTTTMGSARADEVERLVSSSAVTGLLLDLAHEEDLVVVGRHGLGRVSGLRLGSVARRLAAQVPGALVVVGAASKREPAPPA